MQRHLCEHFTLPGHSGFLHGVSIILIDKTDLSCPIKRKDYWKDTLKNKAPMGLWFDFDDSFRAHYLVHFCYWISPALF